MKAMGAMGGYGSGLGGLTTHGNKRMSAPVAASPASPPAPPASRRASDKEVDALLGPRDDRSRSFAKREEKAAKDEKAATKSDAPKSPAAGA